MDVTHDYGYIIKIQMFEWLNTLFLEPERVFGLSSGTPFLSDCVSSFIRVAGSESSKKRERKKDAYTSISHCNYAFRR